MFHHVFPQTLDSLPTIFPSIVKCEINIYAYSCRNWNWLFSTVRDKILHISCRIQDRINYEFRANEILYENGWVNCKTLNLKPCISLFSLIKIYINFPFNFQLNVKKKKQKINTYSQIFLSSIENESSKFFTYFSQPYYKENHRIFLIIKRKYN